MKTCGRCNGTGIYHDAGRVCFGCGGDKIVPSTKAERRAVAVQAAEALVREKEEILARATARRAAATKRLDIFSADDEIARAGRNLDLARAALAAL